MLAKVKKLIEATPLFRDKLTFPALRSTKLRTLINQRCVSFFLTMSSLAVDWQHQLCKTPRPDPDIKTLFTDHTCAVPNGPLAPSSVNPPVTTLTKPTAFPSLGAHGPFPPGTAIAAANSANWPGLPKVCSCLGKRFMCEGWFSSIVQSCRRRAVYASIRLSGPVCEKTHSRKLNRVLGRDKWNFMCTYF
ncbi:PREDICTED: topless-related protein 3-like [Brassica oleracea var. oleracea]|nr:PREDICTED: topless-related protein 3-like [Brassica oleracea var. oleracea]